MERIGITGHTKGIGAALSSLLNKSGFETVGFSRSNGFDLADASTIGKITDQSQYCSVFVNNAFYEWAQVELLYSLYESWKDLDKTIINISSNSSDGIKNYIHKYAVQKAALDKAAEQLSNIPNSKCKVINIKAGWVDTERISKFNVRDPKLSLVNMAQTIL